MNILFELAHPRHYYQFVFIRDILKERGHRTFIAATERKLLLAILKENKEKYILLRHTQSGSIFLKLVSYFSRLKYYASELRDKKIDLLISKASISTFFAKLLKPGLKAVIFPDSEDVRLTNDFSRHFADLIILPKIFPLQWPPKKVLRVNGTAENCYLDPRYFQPEKIDPEDYGYTKSAKFVFFRFVAWKAHHDIGQWGFTQKERIDVVELFLANDYTPLISFEANPDTELEKYVNRFPLSQVRSVLTICDYFVGDSQSMAAEAALLGVKSFRYNSWVLKDVVNFKHFNEMHLLLNFSKYENLKSSLVLSLSGQMDFFRPVTDYWEQCGDINVLISDEIEKRFSIVSKQMHYSNVE